MNTEERLSTEGIRVCMYKWTKQRTKQLRAGSSFGENLRVVNVFLKLIYEFFFQEVNLSFTPEKKN